MVTAIYNKPHEFRDGVWLIGWSKSRFEKCKVNIFHKGSYDEAQSKIDSLPGKKYRKRA